MLSPFRYPGGKSDFVATAHDIVVASGFSGRKIIEPYAGSAAVSLGLLDAGIISEAILVERDPLVYSFWKSITDHLDDLITSFQELPITIETWHAYRDLLKIETPSKSNIIQLGVAALFFNRANFSGILNAGPIGGLEQKSSYPIDCRTNKDDIISRILAAAMHAERIDVHFGDAIEFIQRQGIKNSETLFYIDPPYFEKGGLLYRHFYKLSDHKRLANVLSEVRTPWLLSYDVHPIIEFLYEDFEVNRLRFRYSARSPKNHDELLISNFPISSEFLGPVLRRNRVLEVGKTIQAPV